MHFSSSLASTQPNENSRVFFSPKTAREVLQSSLLKPVVVDSEASQPALQEGCCPAVVPGLVTATRCCFHVL